MHESLCVCDLIEPFESRTHLFVLLHRAEARKSTNTGQLAALCVRGAELRLRGERQETPEPPVVVPRDRLGILLYPAGDARPLPELIATDPRPVTLIVPDGTWRQAARMRKRVPGLDALACATLPKGPPSRYHLREESSPEALSTLEAIARALAIVEGAHAEAALMRPFDAMVQRTLWSRGLLPSAQVHAGLPAGAQRHDPRRPAPR